MQLHRIQNRTQKEQRRECDIYVEQYKKTLVSNCFILVTNFCHRLFPSVCSSIIQKWNKIAFIYILYYPIIIFKKKCHTANFENATSS